MEIGQAPLLLVGQASQALVRSNNGPKLKLLGEMTIESRPSFSSLGANATFTKAKELGINS
jgi:hypothetical protein